MRETVCHVAILLLVTGIVFFTNLGSSRLWDRDEPRNAGCAAEMQARGDWVVPMFNDELRHQKPVLLYWLIMSAYSILGVNEFSARFWSAALATGTTFATYGIARRLVNSTVALYSAIALSTSLMFDVAARAATPDSLLAFCGTMAILVYVLGTFSQSANGIKLKQHGSWFPQNSFFVISMYALLGLGVLAKGPVGFLLPVAIIGLFMLIRTSPKSEPENSDSLLSTLARGFRSCLVTLHPIHLARTWWSMRPILGLAVVLLIATPWYWLVDARTEGDFTRMFFVGEHFGRATRAMESHNGGLWFYPLAILVGFFPWSIFWGPVAVGIVRRRQTRGQCEPEAKTHVGAATTLMLCWIGIQVGAFSIAQTKLPSYVTPCYPALAVLTAICLSQLASRQTHVGRAWFHAAWVGLVISGLAITIGVGFATMKYMPSQFWLTAIGLIPLVGGVLLIWLMARNQTRSIPVVFSATALLFCAGLFGFGTVSLDAEQQSHKLLRRLGVGTKVATYGVLESSWVFYAKRPLVELQVVEQDAPQWKRRVIGEREKFWQSKPQPTVAAFVKSNPDAMLITTDEHLDSIRAQLPVDYQVLQTAEYFLKNKQIVLLGRMSSDLPPVGNATAKHAPVEAHPTNRASIVPVDSSRRR